MANSQLSYALLLECLKDSPFDQGLDGPVVARLGGTEERVAESGKFVAPHEIWADSHKGFYVTEVLQGQRLQKFIRT